MYVLPVYRLTSRIVSEKETRAKESMRMMGLSDVPYWLSWFTYYTITSTFISVFGWAILCINVIEYSGKIYILGYFWLYGMSLFGFIVFIQAFFSRSMYAGIFGTLIYFGSSFIAPLVQSPDKSYGSKTAASILPPVGMTLAANNFAAYESGGLGLDSNTASEMYENYTFNTALFMFFVSLIVFSLIGFWLDKVLPKTYGARLGYFFCFSSSYWAGCCKCCSR
mmetsp:Transcript_40629/g.29239  ORF Transcript_40629/g.29239 Transcript_40629/m.29239 type:complete len:223 (-) Transcript_40629:4084-4752(-)